jgi:hypothetical protein
MPNQKFHYLRLRAGRYGGVDVVGFGTYPRGSVLAGQPMKVFLDNFDTEGEARAKYPQAEGFTSRWTEPTVSLAHLPCESDPVAGGMYPDDLPA